MTENKAKTAQASPSKSSLEIKTTDIPIAEVNDYQEAKTPPPLVTKKTVLDAVGTHLKPMTDSIQKMKSL